MDYWNRNEKGEAVRVKQENYNSFKTKNGRDVFDGGGVFPDESLGAPKNASITKAINDNSFIFDYATEYFYKNNIENINDFQLNDSDFNNFKDYLRRNEFSFETNTEKALLKAFEAAKKEELHDNIQKDYNTLISNLNKTKIDIIDENKAYLLQQLTEEIVKRYVYREGLYDYYKTHDSVIKKATSILNNPSSYQGYLR